MSVTSGRRKAPTASRPKLDQATIVEATRALIDREGLSALTMRRLGAELGADPTAVYRHFRSKQELLTAVVDHLFDQLRTELPSTGSWRSNLRASILFGFSLYRTHPELALELARRNDDAPPLVRAADAMLGELRAAGLSEREAVMTYHTIIDVIVGAGLFYALVPDFADQRERDATRRTLAALPPDTYPYLTAVAPHLFPEVEEVFRSSVELLLDAIELRAARRLARTTEEEA